MKSKFSNSWNRSKQPRKQRKYLANAPHHRKHKLLSSPLGKDLQKKYDRKSLELRKSDEVIVMRGKFTKKTGKIILVDRGNSRVQVDGLTITKKDGEKVPVWFHPSNLKITKIDDSDKMRLKKKTAIPAKKAEPAKEQTKPKEMEK